MSVMTLGVLAAHLQSANGVQRMQCSVGFLTFIAPPTIPAKFKYMYVCMYECMHVNKLFLCIHHFHNTCLHLHVHVAHTRTHAYILCIQTDFNALEKDMDGFDPQHYERSFQTYAYKTHVCLAVVHTNSVCVCVNSWHECMNTCTHTYTHAQTSVRTK
jgi:hypothetical protein